MDPSWFIRLARIARNPPRGRRAWIVLGVVAAVALLGLLDWLELWPESLTPQRLRP